VPEETRVCDDTGVPAAADPAQELRGAGTRFSIDDELCIGCRLCHERAPQNFEVPAHETTARVIRQPSDAAEQAACKEALEYCPTGGIQVTGTKDTEPVPPASPLTSATRGGASSP
jgi:ferredoxin